jgi:methylated-DNA-protein-cysteine methyltransferase-like protein
MKAASTYDRVYAVVRRVPHGRVATYGQVARLAGLVNGARQAGYALHALRPHTTVPWHRVVNAEGRISLGDLAGSVTQRLLLEREGVRFGLAGRVDLSRFQWKARPRAGARPGRSA